VYRHTRVPGRRSGNRKRPRGKVEREVVMSDAPATRFVSVHLRITTRRQFSCSIRTSSSLACHRSRGRPVYSPDLNPIDSRISCWMRIQNAVVMAWANLPRSGIHEAAPDFSHAGSVAVPCRCVAGTVGPTSFLFHSLIFSDVLLWAMDSDAEEKCPKEPEKLLCRMWGR